MNRTSIALLAAAIATVGFTAPLAAGIVEDAPHLAADRVAYLARGADVQPPAGKSYQASALNFITRWSTTSDGVNGTLDDDLIGEATVSAACHRERLGDGPGSQSVSTSDSAFFDGRLFSNWFNIPSSNMDVVRYYVTQVEALADRDAVLLAGADDGIRVWLNGAEVLRQDAPADYQEGSLRATVRLEEGWNLLLVKVYYPQLGPQGSDHEYKYWSLRFVEPDGQTPILDVYQSVDGWCDPADSYGGWAYAPGAADAQGAFGSTWQSELQLTNPYYHNLRVAVQFWANGNPGAAPDGEQVVRLAPFETVRFDNVVRQLTGTSGAGSGVIVVGGLYYLDMESYETARLVTSNVGGPDGGTFGTQMPFDYLYGGSTCCSQQLYGLKNGPDHRTNLLLVPMPYVGDEIEVTVRLWDPVSDRTATAEFTGRGGFQINDVFNRVGMGGVVTETAIAHVSYSSTTSRPYWRIVASVNDNVTSDPTLVGRAPYGIPTPFQ